MIREPPAPLEMMLAAFGSILLVIGLDCACSQPAVHTGPPVPVVVEQTCRLPPVPQLPTATAAIISLDGGSGGRYICFEPEQANRLRARDAKLKQWIREVVARCGSVAKEARDAGSTVEDR